MTDTATLKPASRQTAPWTQHIPIIIALIVVAAAILIPVVLYMRWDWLPVYGWRLVEGLGRTIFVLLFSCIVGIMLAVPIGLVQVTGPWPLRWLASGFCTFIRGTPLLVQIWLLYYGLGSLFPLVPEIRNSFLWPILREAWPYALLAFTMSFAAYEGEILRGGFLSVPKGELEAARSCGMTPWQVLRRVWLPRALYLVLPTLAGETVSQLKSTPLVSTITIFDVFSIAGRVRQDTAIVYEPLLFVALVYMILTGIIVLFFNWLEARVPIKRG
jgi:polar amino acid transport system permease protein